MSVFNCGNCRYYHIINSYFVNDKSKIDKYAICRRYPPVAVDSSNIYQIGVTRYTHTIFNHWCGEHKPADANLKTKGL